MTWSRMLSRWVSRGRCWAIPVLTVVVTGSMVGCATTEKPYVFPEQGATKQAVDATSIPSAQALTVGQVLGLAHEAKRQWAESVRGESDRRRGVSAGLIGLSTIALLKGVTSPNARDMAGLGAASAGLFAWGSTQTSTTRNTIYREGIVTMSCAIEVVEPFNSAEWIGSGTQTVEKLIDDAQAAQAKLDEWIERLRPFNVAEEKDVPAKAPPSACTALSSPSCTAAAPNSAEAKICDGLRPQCVPRAASKMVRSPDPAFAGLMAAAQSESQAVDKVIGKALQMKGRSLQLTGWLLQTGTEIEAKVREGVEKTEPDLATVLSVSQAMKSPPSADKPAPSGTGASAAEGTAHSKPNASNTLSTAAKPEGMTDLQASVTASQASRRPLERRISILETVMSRERSETCRRVLPLSFELEKKPQAENSPPKVSSEPKGDKPDETVRSLPKTGTPG